MGNKRTKKSISLEGFVFLAIFLGIFGGMGMKMGGVNMLNTLMNTGYQLLLETVFYIMAIAVLAGAISGLFSEFGVISMVNKLLSPLMKPLYNLPGAAALGVITTYLSDNPAILGLAEDKNFRKYFKKFQLPALTNLGTSFGMGLIVSTFMIGLKLKGGHAGTAVLVGNFSAIIGSVHAAPRPACTGWTARWKRPLRCDRPSDSGAAPACAGRNPPEPPFCRFRPSSSPD